MDNKDFYNDTFNLVLQSNGSLNYHSNNTPSNFTIQFDKHIVLQRSMEMALEEIILPNHINNISKSKIYLILELYSAENVGPDDWVLYKEEALFELEIEETKISDGNGLYNHLLEKIKTIEIDDVQNKVLSLPYLNELSEVNFELTLLPKLAYQHVGKKIEMIKGKLELRGKIPENPRSNKTFVYYLYWKFDENIGNMIGIKNFNFRKFADLKMKEPIISEYAIKIPKHITNLYVYIDIIKPTYYNNDKCSLVRILPNNPKSSKYLHYSFNHLLYYPIKKQTIESINVIIKDEENNIVNISNGNVIVILKFRPLEHI